MKIDADIRQLTEMMQQRRREAKKRVAEQEIIGIRFMHTEDVRSAALRNWSRFAASTECDAHSDIRDVADAAAYALEYLKRVAPDAQK